MEFLHFIAQVLATPHGTITLVWVVCATSLFVSASKI